MGSGQKKKRKEKLTSTPDGFRMSLEDALSEELIEYFSCETSALPSLQ